MGSGEFGEVGFRLEMVKGWPKFDAGKHQRVKMLRVSRADRDFDKNSVSADLNWWGTQLGSTSLYLTDKKPAGSLNTGVLKYTARYRCQ